MKATVKHGHILLLSWLVLMLLASLAWAGEASYRVMIFQKGKAPIQINNFTCNGAKSIPTLYQGKQLTIPFARIKAITFEGTKYLGNINYVKARIDYRKDPALGVLVSPFVDFRGTDARGDLMVSDWGNTVTKIEFTLR